MFKDMDDNIIHLNGKFELQLTIEDRSSNDFQGNQTFISADQFRMIEVF